MFRFLLKLLTRAAANLAALLIAAYAVPGFTLSAAPKDLALLTALLLVGNALVRPLLKLILAPLVALTLGLFTLVINALILASIDFLSPSLMIQGMRALLLSTLIVSAANIVAGLGAKLFIRGTTP